MAANDASPSDQPKADEPRNPRIGKNSARNEIAAQRNGVHTDGGTAAVVRHR